MTIPASPRRWLRRGAPCFSPGHSRSSFAPSGGPIWLLDRNQLRLSSRGHRSRGDRSSLGHGRRAQLPPGIVDRAKSVWNSRTATPCDGQAGYDLPIRDRRTRAERYETLTEDFSYAPSALDRTVVAPNQIRTSSKPIATRSSLSFPRTPRASWFLRTPMMNADAMLARLGADHPLHAERQRGRVGRARLPPCDIKIPYP